MKSSTALTAYHANAPLIEDDEQRIDRLPDDLQGVAAELLDVITDAAYGKDPAALARLRMLARVLKPKPTKDPHQRDRARVLTLLDRMIGANPRMLLLPGLLLLGLGRIDRAFRKLSPAFVSAVMKERSRHRLAARLSVECGALGDAPGAATRTAKTDAIARAKSLFEASVREASRRRR
jgi:hypothetical protein